MEYLNTSIRIAQFKLFLEGVEVPFNSASIVETEGQIPSLSINFGVNYEALKLLPGTIVQLFGKFHDEKEFFLLFEGELISNAFQRSSSGEGVSINAVGILYRMMTAQLRPVDSLVTRETEEASGISKVHIESSKINNVIIRTENAVETINATPDDKNIFDGKIDDCGTVSVLGGLATYFATQLDNDQPAGKGNFISLFNNINSIFELSDIYYGIQSLSLYLSSSIFAFPNPGDNRAFQLRAAFESINQLLQSYATVNLESTPNFTYMNLLNAFEKYMSYKFIAPAAYPSVYQVYRNETEKYGPLRAFLMPEIESGPPPLCNIFFPEQVTSITYSRDMSAEPTRIIGSAVVKIGTQPLVPVWMNSIYVIPNLKLFNYPKNFRTNFTEEESYRGINPAYRMFDYAEIELMKEAKNIDLNDPKDVIASMHNFVLQDYLVAKYKNRYVSITTEWNPYRMLGLPALVFDLEKPNILGIITKITTSISATGSATSQITLRNCRLLFSDNTNSIFVNVEDKNINPKLKQFLVDDSVQEGMLAANQVAYNEYLYDFKTIGVDIYTYLLTGKINKYGELINQVNENKNSFKELECILNPNNKIYDIDSTDRSLLFFIKEVKDGKLKFKDYVIEEVNKEPWLNCDEAVLNTKLLYMALNEFKNFYKAIKENSNLSIFDYINLMVRRKLCTMSEYLDYIGAYNLPSNKLFEDTKDLSFILKQMDYNYSTLRNQILETGNEQKKGLKKSQMVINTIKTNIESIVEQINNLEKEKKDILAKNDLNLNLYISNIDAKLKELNQQKTDLENEYKSILSKDEAIYNCQHKNAIFRPYNITRRAHVISSFNKFISNDIVITRG